MKNKIALLMIVLLLLSSFSSCGLTSVEEKRSSEIESKVMEEYHALLSVAKEYKSIEQFGNYLLKWAARRDIRASYDQYGNIIMSKSPTEGYGTDHSLNIQSGIGLDHLEDRCLAVAMSLYIIENTSENNFMRLIFTNNENGDFSGAKGISSGYLSIENQINLDWTHEEEKAPPEFLITNGSAGAAVHQISTPYELTGTTFTKAYQISIDDLNGGSSGIVTGKHPNPIKLLGDLLAGCKSSGILFELATIQGGSSPDTYPTNASIQVVINDNDVNRFTNRVESAQNKFDDAYDKIEEKYSFTLTEMPLPEQVLTTESADRIVSLLYTLVNGVYLRDEETGDILTTSNLGQIMTEGNRMELFIVARSIEKNGLHQLNDTLDIIASLSEVDHKLLEESPVWQEEGDNLLLKRMIEIGAEKYGIEPKIAKSFEVTENPLFNSNENLGNLVSVKVHMENYILQTQLLLDLLKVKNTTK